MVVMVIIWASTTFVDDDDNEHFEYKRCELVESRAHVDALVKALEKRVKRTFAYVCVVNGANGDTLHESAIPGEQDIYYSSELTV